MFFLRSMADVDPENSWNFGVENDGFWWGC